MNKEKEITQGALGFKPDSYYLSTTAANIQQTNFYKTRSGRTTTLKIRNKGSLMMSSSFCDNNQIQSEIRSKKMVLEKLYNTVRKFNYLTLSYYFLKEKDLYFKFLDPKKKRRDS